LRRRNGRWRGSLSSVPELSLQHRWGVCRVWHCHTGVSAAFLNFRDLPARRKKLRLTDDGSASNGKRAGVVPSDAADRRGPFGPMLNVAQGCPDQTWRRFDVDSGVEMLHRSTHRERGPGPQCRFDPSEMVVTVALWVDRTE